MTTTVVRRLLGLEIPERTNERPAGALSSASVLALVAGLSLIAGLIHVSASVSHFSTLPTYAVAFAAVALAQICWASWLFCRPSKAALATGLVANLGIIVLWGTSLMAGVRVVPHVHAHPVYLCLLTIVPTSGTGASLLPAVVASVPALVIALATSCLLAEHRSRLARFALSNLAPVLFVAMFLSALYGVGGHAA
jgi:hypothetical protein